MQLPTFFSAQTFEDGSAVVYLTPLATEVDLRLRCEVVDGLVINAAVHSSHLFAASTPVDIPLQRERTDSYIRRNRRARALEHLASLGYSEDDLVAV